MERFPMNEFGEPNMGNPSVRFDEGRKSVGHWPLCLSTHPLPPTLRNGEEEKGKIIKGIANLRFEISKRKILRMLSANPESVRDGLRELALIVCRRSGGAGMMQPLSGLRGFGTALPRVAPSSQQLG